MHKSEQPSGLSTFNVLKISVTQRPHWEGSISIPGCWRDGCVYLNPFCAHVCMCFTVCFQRQMDWWMMGGMCIWERAVRQHAFAYRVCSHVQAKMCLLIHCSCSTWQPWIRGHWSNPWNWTSWIWKNLRRNNYNLSKQQAHAWSSLPCSGFWPSTVDTGSRQRLRFHVVTPGKKISAY